jgi:hypothetical protein
MELELEQHGVGWAKARGENHPRGQNRARHRPSKTGVNALVAHMGTMRQAILPTLQLLAIGGGQAPDFAVARRRRAWTRLRLNPATQLSLSRIVVSCVRNSHEVQT